MSFVLVANRLLDGSVVYLAEDDTWTEAIGSAKRLDSEEEKRLAEATGNEAVNACHVIGAELVALAETCSELKPARLRETIRAIGPTVRPDLARATH